MIRGLTLTQPWASLVAHGFKAIETRSWRTPYRGPLAVHAGKGLGGIIRPDGRKANEDDLHALCQEWPFRDCLATAGYGEPEGPIDASLLPRGLIVATCHLSDIVSTEEALEAGVGELEKQLGNFRPGRYAWLLDGVEVLDPPAEIPPGLRRVIDMRGLWQIPESVVAR